MKFSAVRKLIRKVKAEMVLLQETKKEVVTEREVAKLWYDDAFNFVENPSIGKSGSLLLIWDSSKFKMEKCHVNVRMTKGMSRMETTGPALAEISAGIQISAERLAVLLAYP
ncbi:hypothetical protein GQ457_10G000270 [Hibiscus cannabinus]